MKVGFGPLMAYAGAAAPTATTAGTDQAAPFATARRESPLWLVGSDMSTPMVKVSNSLGRPVHNSTGWASRKTKFTQPSPERYVPCE